SKGMPCSSRAMISILVPPTSIPNLIFIDHPLDANSRPSYSIDCAAKVCLQLNITSLSRLCYCDTRRSILTSTTMSMGRCLLFLPDDYKNSEEQVVKSILLPAIKLMNRLKLVYKFSLISVLFLLPIIALGYSLVSQMIEDIDQIEREVEGLQALDTATNLLKEAGKYRDFRAVARIRGIPELEEASLRQRAQIGILLEELEALPLSFDSNQDLGGQVTVLRDEWRKLVADDANQMMMQAQFTYYDEYVRKVQALVTSIAQVSGLAQDNSSEVQLLLELSNKNLLAAADAISYARSLWIFALIETRLDAETSEAGNNSFDQLSAIDTAWAPVLDVVASRSAKMGGNLSKSLEAVCPVVLDARDFLDEHVIVPIVLDLPWQEYERVMTQHLDHLYGFNGELLSA